MIALRRAVIAAAPLLALALPACAGQPSPLSMQADRGPLTLGQPASICANVMASGVGCQSIGTMTPDGKYSLPDMTGAKGLFNTTHAGTAADPSTTPSLLPPHFYSGLPDIRSSLIQDSVAIDPVHPEQTAIFRMTSSVGQSQGPTNVPPYGLDYKMPFGAEGTFNKGSAPGWGATIVANFGPGYASTNTQYDLELDHNNLSGFNCPDGDLGVVGTIGCGSLIITGAGQNQITFGLAISGYSKIRNGIQFSSGGPIATSLRDYSSSQVVYKDTGSHINGFDGSGASYSGNFLAGPGNAFQVDGRGELTIAPVATAYDISVAANAQVVLKDTGQHITGFDGSNATYSAAFLIGPRGTSSINGNGDIISATVLTKPVTFAQLPACGAGNQGMRAYITDGAAANFAAPAAGGGGIHVGVTCNSAQWTYGG